MAVEIKVGDYVSLKDKKSGSSDKGYWCLIPVKNGTKTINIWAENAEEASKFNGKAKIVEIISVKATSRKYQDKWYDQVNVGATLERLNDADFFQEGGFAPEEFGGQASFVDATDDENLPFN